MIKRAAILVMLAVLAFGASSCDEEDAAEAALYVIGVDAAAEDFGASTVVLIATSLPAWGSLLTGSSSATLAPAVTSSPGETANVTTRVEGFGAHSFFSQNAFVANARLYDDVDGVSSPYRFLEGVRQAGIADIVNGAILEAGVPFQDHALATQRSLDAWNAAVAGEVLRQQAASAPPAFAGPVNAIWESNLAPGTIIQNVTVTFYACVGNGFCGNMATGHQVFPGAAACSIDMAFGTKFVVVNDPTQTVFTCLDRGALASPWVDVWFYTVEQGHAWQAAVGSVSDIRIVE